MNWFEWKTWIEWSWPPSAGSLAYWTALVIVSTWIWYRRLDLGADGFDWRAAAHLAGYFVCAAIAGVTLVAIASLYV